MFVLLLQIAVDLESSLMLHVYILGCQFVTADHLPLGQGFSISCDIY